MTTAATSNLVENGKAALDLARRQTLKLVDDIPADKLCHQPVAGTNHALWVLGHLAYSDDGFTTALGERESVIDESWKELFGMGSKPGPDPAKYPSLDDIKAALPRARTALIDWIESLDEEQLLKPLPEGWDVFAPNYAAVLPSLAWHEGFHAGQLSAVRRSLGLPGTMG